MDSFHGSLPRYDKMALVAQRNYELRCAGQPKAEKEMTTHSSTLPRKPMDSTKRIKVSNVWL